jgi:hypothetical protein
VREAHLRNSGRAGMKAEHQMPTFWFLFSHATALLKLDEYYEAISKSVIWNFKSFVA